MPSIPRNNSTPVPLVVQYVEPVSSGLFASHYGMRHLHVLWLSQLFVYIITTDIRLSFNLSIYLDGYLVMSYLRLLLLIGMLIPQPVWAGAFFEAILEGVIKAGMTASEESLKQQEIERQKELIREEYRLKEEARFRAEEEGRRKAAEDARKIAEENRKNEVSTGSGFFVSTGGYLVTNAHVVDGFENISIKDITRRTLPATLIAIDKDRDLALLKVDGRHKPLRIIPSSQIHKGQRVIAVGYPQPSIQGSESKITDGLISSFSGLRNDDNWFQISVPIQGGNSGGPLVNQSGGVVGVVVATVNAKKFYSITGDFPQNVNFAIKSDILLDFLSDNQIRNIGFRGGATDIDIVDRSTVLVICKHGKSPSQSRAILNNKETSYDSREQTVASLTNDAKNGNREAQFKLGNIYERGEAVPKNLEKAFEWWLKSASQGFVNAQYSVGMSYMRGDGVNEDMVRSYAWLLLASEQGHEGAKRSANYLENKMNSAKITEGKRLASNWRN